MTQSHETSYESSFRVPCKFRVQSCESSCEVSHFVTLSESSYTFSFCRTSLMSVRVVQQKSKKIAENAVLKKIAKNAAAELRFSPGTDEYGRLSPWYQSDEWHSVARPKVKIFCLCGFEVHTGAISCLERTKLCSCMLWGLKYKLHKNPHSLQFWQILVFIAQDTIVNKGNPSFKHKCLCRAYNCVVSYAADNSGKHNRGTLDNSKTWKSSHRTTVRLARDLQLQTMTVTT